MGAQIESSREQFASHMEQRRNIAAMRGAQMEMCRAEFVSHMGQRLNVAAARGALNILKRDG